MQIKAKVENGSQMYSLKLHTLWSPMKKDGYIGIIGYFDVVKQKNTEGTQRESPDEKEKMEQSVFCVWNASKHVLRRHYSD